MLPGDCNEAPHRILRKGQLLCSSSQCWHYGALQVELASLLPSLALATGREGWQGGYLCRLGRGSFPESRMLGTLQTFCRMLGSRRRTAGGRSCTLCSRCQHRDGSADPWFHGSCVLAHGPLLWKWTQSECWHEQPSCSIGRSGWEPKFNKIYHVDVLGIIMSL